MSDILQEIVRKKRIEIEQAKALRPPRELVRALVDAPPVRSFVSALQAGPEIRLIAEVKRQSPSAGLIRADFDPVRIARTYAGAGAACLSVLTDREFFGGALEFLVAIRAAVGIPLLRKDFILDEYQIHEARVAGADCVLLIAECLEPAVLKRLHECATGLGMDCLVELHDSDQLPAVLACAPTMIGVNNRDLRTFQVDLARCLELRPAIPPSILMVGESGIRNRTDALRLQAGGIKAMLVGESLMRQEDLAAAVRNLLGTAGDAAT